jgi:manganese transport protein
MLLIAASGGKNTVDLLVNSQVVLSMQLSFAIFPLLMFTSDRKRMGEFANPLWLKVVGYAVCCIIAALNLKLLFDKFGLVWFSAGILVAGAFGLWVMFGYKQRPQPDNI